MLQMPNFGGWVRSCSRCLALGGGSCDRCLTLRVGVMKQMYYFKGWDHAIQMPYLRAWWYFDRS